MSCRPELQALRSDYTLVMTAVRDSGLALRLASDDLRNNREIVKAAVAGNGAALQFASSALRADRDIVMEAVCINSDALEAAAPELRDDAGIVMAAINNSAHALQHASDRIRTDAEMVMAAVSKDGWVCRYASDELLADEGFVQTAVPYFHPTQFLIRATLLSGRSCILLIDTDRDTRHRDLLIDRCVAKLGLGEDERSINLLLGETPVPHILADWHELVHGAINELSLVVNGQ